MKLIDSVPGDSRQLSADDFWLNDVKTHEPSASSVHCVPRETSKDGKRMTTNKLRGTSGHLYDSIAVRCVVRFSQLWGGA